MRTRRTVNERQRWKVKETRSERGVDKMMVQVTHRLSSSASAIVGRFRKQCTQSRTPEGPNKNASRSPRLSEVGACGMNRPSLMRERTHKADGPSFLHFICAPTAATACTHGASARSTDAPAAVLASSSHLLLHSFPHRWAARHHGQRNAIGELDTLCTHLRR